MTPENYRGVALAARVAIVKCLVSAPRVCGQPARAQSLIAILLQCNLNECVRPGASLLAFVILARSPTGEGNARSLTKLNLYRPNPL